MNYKNIIFDICGVLFDFNPHYHQSSSENLFVPIKEGIELLEACAHQAQQTGRRLFICSNIQDPHLEVLMKDYPDTLDLFKAVVTPSSAQAKKPSPEIFKYLMDRHDIMPHESIFIDDQLSNVEAAQAAGMIGIHAVDLGQVRDELLKLGIM